MAGNDDDRYEPEIEEDKLLQLVVPIGVSPLAIIAGYLGLFAVLVFPAPLALLFGILGVRHIKKNPKRRGLGRSIFGIVMGAIGTLVLLVGICVVKFAE